MGTSMVSGEDFPNKTNPLILIIGKSMDYRYGTMNGIFMGLLMGYTSIKLN